MTAVRYFEGFTYSSSFYTIEAGHSMFFFFLGMEKRFQFTLKRIKPDIGVSKTRLLYNETKTRIVLIVKI